MTKRLLCLTKTTLCPFIQLWHLAFLRHCSLSLPWKWLSCQFCEKVIFFLSSIDNIFPDFFIFVENSIIELESETLKIVIGYLFGAAASVSLVGIAKFTIGRLRPHFLDVCKPDFDQIECGTFQRPNYITEYTCLGNEVLFPTKVLIWINSKNFEKIEEYRLKKSWRFYFSRKRKRKKSCFFSRMREISPCAELETAFILVIHLLLSKQPHF